MINRSTKRWPSACPVCGEALAIGPLELPGEAACRHCGHVLWFALRKVGDVTVLDVISGKVAVNMALEQIARVIMPEGTVPRVILNLANIQFVSSSFIAGLVALNRRVNTARGKLVLCELTPVVRETLEGAKLNRLLDIAATEQEALSRFAPEGSTKPD